MTTGKLNLEVTDLTKSYFPLEHEGSDLRHSWQRVPNPPIL